MSHAGRAGGRRKHARDRANDVVVKVPHGQADEERDGLDQHPSGHAVTAHLGRRRAGRGDGLRRGGDEWRRHGAALGIRDQAGLAPPLAHARRHKLRALRAPPILPDRHAVGTWLATQRLLGFARLCFASSVSGLPLCHLGGLLRNFRLHFLPDAHSVPRARHNPLPACSVDGLHFREFREYSLLLKFFRAACLGESRMHRGGGVGGCVDTLDTTGVRRPRRGQVAVACWGTRVLVLVLLLMFNLVVRR